MTEGSQILVGLIAILVVFTGMALIRETGRRKKREHMRALAPEPQPYQQFLNVAAKVFVAIVVIPMLLIVSFAMFPR